MGLHHISKFTRHILGRSHFDQRSGSTYKLAGTIAAAEGRAGVKPKGSATRK